MKQNLWWFFEKHNKCREWEKSDRDTILLWLVNGMRRIGGESTGRDTSHHVPTSWSHRVAESSWWQEENSDEQMLRFLLCFLVYVFLSTLVDLKQSLILSSVGTDQHQNHLNTIKTSVSEVNCPFTARKKDLIIFFFTFFNSIVFPKNLIKYKVFLTLH